MSLYIRAECIPVTLPDPDDADDTDSPQLCEWFVRCRRPAAGVVNHPILGPVPTCRECADTYDLELIPYDD